MLPWEEKRHWQPGDVLCLGRHMGPSVSRKQSAEALWTAAVPNLFGTGGRFPGRQFSTDWDGGDAFGMSQVHYLQADLLLCGPVPRPGGCGPLLWRGAY